MNARVIDTDDLTLHNDRIWNVDHVCKNIGQAQRKCSLPVTRRPVQKNRAARVQRWPGLFDEGVFHRQIADVLADTLKRHNLIGNLLQIDPFVVFLEGNGGRTRVLRSLQRLNGPTPTLVGQRVIHGGAILRAHPPGVDKLALRGYANQFDDDVGRQLDRIRKLPRRLQPPRVNQLHQQAYKLLLVEAGSLNTFGLNRRFIDESIQRLAADVTSSDKMVPKASTLPGLTLERIVHLLDGDQLRPDQQLSKLHSNCDDVPLNSSSVEK